MFAAVYGGHGRPKQLYNIAAVMAYLRLQGEDRHVISWYLSTEIKSQINLQYLPLPHIKD